MAGAAENALPSILYCILNPGTEVTAGKVKAAAHVLPGVARTGAIGKITTLIVLLVAHKPGPVVPATVLPHVAART